MSLYLYVGVAQEVVLDVVREWIRPALYISCSATELFAITLALFQFLEHVLAVHDLVFEDLLLSNAICQHELVHPMKFAVESFTGDSLKQFFVLL